MNLKKSSPMRISVPDQNLFAYNDANVTTAYERHDILHREEIIIFLRFRDAFLGKNVLDIGCGGGRTTGFLLPFCAKYTGIDYSSAMVQLCRKRFHGVDFHECDVRDMGMFPENCFDFILFSFNGIDYVSHEDRLQGFNEIHRVLKHGGFFIFSSHNRMYMKNRKFPTKPWLERSFNPLKMFANIKKFLKRRENYSKTEVYFRNEAEYAIINDGAHDFSLATYYIDMENQIKQIRDANFSVEAVYNKQGICLDFNTKDELSGSFYYVTKKI